MDGINGKNKINKTNKTRTGKKDPGEVPGVLSYFSNATGLTKRDGISKQARKPARKKQNNEGTPAPIPADQISFTPGANREIIEQTTDPSEYFLKPGQKCKEGKESEKSRPLREKLEDISEKTTGMRWDEDF